MTGRNLRGIAEDFRTARREDQALTPIAGAIAGIALAFVIERYGPEPDPADFAITTSQARASLLSALALVFTGLSIVLALTALAAGNMAGKFSPRLLRMRLSGSGNKWVLAAFALTAAFIVASQILLRGRDGDALAPPLTMSVSVVLLILTGVMIVWYINGTLQSMRVDRAIRWIGRRILRSIVAQEHARRHDDIRSEIDLARPLDAIDVVAPDDGYLTDVDTAELHRVAGACDGCIVISATTGDAVVEGEVIGHAWAPSPLTHRDLDAIAASLTVARTRDPDRDIGYSVGVLAEIALMALSPAVNDPKTGVECTEKLTEVWAAMSQVDMGNRTRSRDDGSYTVVAHENTMGDFMDATGRQILRYGSGDQGVTAALARMARQAERTANCERDRRIAGAFASDVDAVLRTLTSPDVRGEPEVPRPASHRR